ncbi:hypothetical protein [Quatrionicoccus australiensis]|uniref:hypothetical protein n=1 Tax=Quatrionicoccus australiensis TaxID=138118 RepID=UPI001CFB7DA7|nr:hypothetical protein [Quatrionicoccus australiensis]MCB4358436.1 hypothetical protein [Quatrionicoccus australiensis]
MLRHATYKRNEKDFATKVVEDDSTGLVTLYVDDKAAVTSDVDELTGVLSFSGAGGELDVAGRNAWDEYRTLLRLDQASGTPKDYSGQGNDGFLRPSYAEGSAWANSGYLTTAASTDAYAMIPGTVASIDFTKRNCILSMVINMAAPASEIFSLFTFGNTTAKGFYFGATAAGKLKLTLCFDDGTTANFGVTNGTFCDSSDHTLGLVIDRVTGNVWLFKDGVIDTVAYGIATKPMTMSSAYRVGLGGPCNNVDTGISGYATKLKGLHLIAPRALPLNVAHIMRRLHDSPLDPLRNNEIVFRREDDLRLLAVAGQSNESGSGVKASAVAVFGPPQADAVAPSGAAGKRSMWPRLIETMGRRGHWMHVYNDAHGGSSIVDGWVGRIRNWASGDEYVNGSYALSDGKLWRANLSTGTLASAAPTGTADMTTADGIAWVYLGAPTVQDVVGVCGRNHPRFDPLGYCAHLAIGLGWNYAHKWGLIQFGQTDSSPTVGVSRANYKTAHIELAKYMLEHGAEKVMLGLSIYTSVGGRDAIYTGTLRPAIADAILEAADSRIVAGADLREAVGVLSTSAVSGVPGLQSDQYHGNDACYRAMTDAWADRMIALGW